MNGLLAMSRGIDAVTDRLGRFLTWFILAAVLISGTNAILRKVFNIGSNAWLEVQWYLFAAVFMLGAGYAFLKNAHVRIDFISGRLSARARNWIDIIGIVVFLVLVQALSELVKRIAFLRGLIPDPLAHAAPEEETIDELEGQE
jgi:TRAP-type mannitol/chloroaromatic compound transport system permease small subunit